jgi:hypothetical protein
LLRFTTEEGGVVLFFGRIVSITEVVVWLKVGAVVFKEIPDVSN